MFFWGGAETLLPGVRKQAASALFPIFGNFIQKTGKTHVTLARPGRQFVQTERATHEAWARLILQNNRSAQLMHVLCSQLDDATNAVVASQKTLAKLMGCSDRTVRNALTPLIEGQWIQ